MSEFEIVVLTLSLVLGLGVAQMLSALAAEIRGRRRRGLHWVPVTWAFLIFLLHVQYFFALMDMDAAGTTWTWDRYGPVLLYVVLLFLAGALVLPSPGTERGETLGDDFDEHGKLALLPLALSLLLSCGTNVQAGGAWISLANLANVVLIALIAGTVLAGRGPWRGRMTVASAAVQLWAFVFVWSNPGTRAPFT